MSRIKPAPARTPRRPVLSSDDAEYAEFYRLLAQVDPAALLAMPPDLPPDHPARVAAERVPKDEIAALHTATADRFEATRPGGRPMSAKAAAALERQKRRAAIYQRAAIASWWRTALMALMLPSSIDALAASLADMFAGRDVDALEPPQWPPGALEGDPPNRLRLIVLTRSTMTAAPPRYAQSRNAVGLSHCAA